MSWLDIAPDSPFSLANLPFGIISTSGNSTPRAAVAVGTYAFDLSSFSPASAPAKVKQHWDAFSQPTLNTFASLGRPFHREVRGYLQSVLKDASNKDAVSKCLVPLAEVTNHLPLKIGDYTDFYASTNHAYNIGVLFRGPDNALQPNYKHLPVAYHGRASSVVVSGTPIRRPWGQILLDPKAEPKVPTFTPCKRLDLELEMGMFICTPNNLGEPVDVQSAEEHIFGYVLMNDWSARDIQAWEYVPLGPFTSKNLGTSISPWVVLADAAIPRAEGLPNENQLASYLQEGKKANMLDISLEVDLITANGKKKTITKTSSKNLLWSWPQMIAHHTITGCNLQPGDLFGSGTISGTETGTEGSLLEQTKGGKMVVNVEDEERKFLLDGDSIVIRGWAGKDGERIGFGEVGGQILAPLDLGKK